MRVQSVRFRRRTAYAVSAGSASTVQHSGYALPMHMVRYTGMRPEPRLPPRNVERRRRDSSIATMWAGAHASWLVEEVWQGSERGTDRRARGRGGEKGRADVAR